MTLVELTDDDFAAMVRGDPSVRPGLAQPPGGVDEPAVLAHLRELAAKLHRDGYAGGHWMMVADGEVVGLCGIKAPPSREGEIEIGYGVAASRRRRGHATAAVGAIIQAARRDPAIRAIIALTALGNAASQRALDRNGFERVGLQADPDDGDVFCWRKQL
jgi:RimJ/RimL family protein N-acetyltransferase